MFRLCMVCKQAGCCIALVGLHFTARVGENKFFCKPVQLVFDGGMPALSKDSAHQQQAKCSHVKHRRVFKFWGDLNSRMALDTVARESSSYSPMNTQLRN